MKGKRLLVAVAIAALGFAAACGRGASGSGRTKPTERLFGLNFGPYVRGLNPDRGDRVGEALLRSLLEVAAPNARWLRTFGTEGGLELMGPLAREFDVNLAASAWISRDRAANERQIEALIAMGRAGYVDLAVVGTEALLRRDVSPAELRAYLDRVKAALPGMPVSTADVYDVLLDPDNAAVLEACDVVLMNVYPYWEGFPIEAAVSLVHSAYTRMQAASGGRSVWVAETGWPSDGNPVGDAVPGAENAAFYFVNFLSWAKATGAPYLYFEFMDERWKEIPEGPQGKHWGLWTEDGVLKPGMAAGFEGVTIPDNWSDGGVIGGPGEPTLELTFVPPVGSFENLRGRVLHVAPALHKVTAYIRVQGRWWGPKPTFAQPQTPIRPDGSFVVDITTGGVDSEASTIAAYLIENAYDPPALSGVASLPQELETETLAGVVVDR